MNEREVRHITIIFGRLPSAPVGSSIRGDNPFKMGWLCESEPRRATLVTSDPAFCDACLLIESVLKANVPAWWRAVSPFSHRGTLTICARFYALCILGQNVQTDFKTPPPPLFTKWQLAGTYNYLRSHVEAHAKYNGGEMAGSPTLKLVMKGCHYCGSAPHHANHVRWLSCPVCGSSEINT